MDAHLVATPLPSQWQSDADLPHRREMVKAIISFLVSGMKQQRVTLDIRTVLLIAKHVELDLYKSAHNLEAYNEASTLEKRVWEVSLVLRKLGAGSFRWQGYQDLPTRRRMITLITKILKEELEAEYESVISSNVLVSKFARHVEASMYQSAPCFVAYADERTVQSRIRLLRVSDLKG